ncbi:cyclase [Saccharopolyspora sp. WRP15-2]|uniref:Cyclase n=1 Tax=Saccharopolyspora oryzae TaxID=2997343 RepID=A0ABT4V414_9PSEU|nr:cyclase [Saccharopolyspora oryzae]MDA3628700.1 cyclase [Saccharopolyspora oryzae]
MMSLLRGRRAATAAALAAAAALTLSPQALAAAVNINFDCSGASPVGEQKFSMQQGADVTAPANVAPGGALDIVIDPAVNTIPGDVNGFTVKRVENMDLKIPIPANSTFVSADLAGGSGLGPNPPTITVEGNTATLHLDGPIAGGSQFELPTVTAHLTAGDSGTIETKLAGTSYDDPGLTFTAVVSSIIGDTNVPSKCFPNPNPVLTTTTIG